MVGMEMTVSEPSTVEWVAANWPRIAGLLLPGDDGLDRLTAYPH